MGFRYACRQAAQAHGVTGWVRNCDDGTVEAVFEGEPVAVEALLSWCGRGPRQARVESVEVTERPAEGAARFEIRE